MKVLMLLALALPVVGQQFPFPIVGGSSNPAAKPHTIPQWVADHEDRLSTLEKRVADLEIKIAEQGKILAVNQLTIRVLTDIVDKLATRQQKKLALFASERQAYKFKGNWSSVDEAERRKEQGK